MKHERGLYKRTKGKKAALVTLKVIYWSSIFVQRTTTPTRVTRPLRVVRCQSEACVWEPRTTVAIEAIAVERTSCFRFCRRGEECLSGSHIQVGERNSSVCLWREGRLTEISLTGPCARVSVSTVSNISIPISTILLAKRALEDILNISETRPTPGRADASGVFPTLGSKRRRYQQPSPIRPHKTVADGPAYPRRGPSAKWLTR